MKNLEKLELKIEELGEVAVGSKLFRADEVEKCLNFFALDTKDEAHYKSIEIENKGEELRRQVKRVEELRQDVLNSENPEEIAELNEEIMEVLNFQEELIGELKELEIEKSKLIEKLAFNFLKELED